MTETRVLILGHSFIRRLREFVNDNSLEYNLTLGIPEPVTVRWRGVGGRTVVKLKEFDLAIVSEFKPDIIFLQVGTNDLAQRNMSPVTVGSAIEEFVTLLHEKHGVRFICVGQTIKRASPDSFNARVALLARYLKTVLEPLPYALYWTHRGFWRSRRPFLSYDGVHLNREGQHKLYKSIRGAVLQAIRQLNHLV